MKDLFKAGDYIFLLTKTRRLNFDTNFHSSTTNDAEISHSDTTKSSVWNSPSFHFHTKYEKWAYSVSIASFDYDCKCVSSHRPCLSEEVLKWLTLLMVLLRLYYGDSLRKVMGFCIPHICINLVLILPCSFFLSPPPPYIYKVVMTGRILKTTCCELETGLIILGEGSACIF